MGDALELATMLFADEILPPERIEDMPDPGEVKTTKRELEIAKQLVDSLAGDFEPAKYHDTYREQVLALIERKAQGEEIAVQPPAEEVPAPTPDLMSALKASLEAVRGHDAGEGDGAPSKTKRAPKSPATKKPAAKKARPARAPAKR
jgi:DNA end-binding protein Ku